MDNGLSANDPYRQMDSGEEGIEPDFLKDKSGTAQKALGAMEQAANLAMAVKGGGGKAATGGKAGGVGGLGGGNVGSKKGFEDGLKSGISSAEKAEANEKSPKSLYNNGKSSGHESNVKNDKDGDTPSLKIPSGLKAMAPVLAILLILFGILWLLIGRPIAVLGAIDYNLQKALGFLGTVGILEKQGEHVTEEIAKSGNFPSKYSSDLASNGLDVGQITANGDFIKTDTYIANIEERDDLVAAASGFAYSSDEEGELAFLYDGKVIRADDFVAAVESDPKLYAAYSRSADIAVRYYYGKDVSKVYKSMKLSRGSFNNWNATGDYKTDEASFREILDDVLDGKTNTDLKLGAVQDDVAPNKTGRVVSCWFSLFSVGDNNCGGNATYIESVSEGKASDITTKIADKTKAYIYDWYTDTCYETKYDAEGKPYQSPYTCQKAKHEDGQTKRAAELLNTAVSAKLPYLSARAFMGVEEPIQRTRIGDNGPANQLMNIMGNSNSVTYRDVATGNTVTKKVSIFETQNFQAAVGEKPYSMDEAASFARDSVLQATGQADKDTIKKTTISSNGLKKSTTAVRNGTGNSADKDTISKANDSVSMAISEKNSDLFETIIGGNRIEGGGAFLSGYINQKVIAAMPSDADTVASYQTELNEVIARKEAADRASLSPFDISSPNTFLGSIVHNLATAMVGAYGSGTTSILSTIQAAGNVTGDAVANLTGTVSAESFNQQFTSLSPSYCKTVNTIKVEGDLYCDTHNTVSTEYMYYTMGDWQGSAVGSSIDGDGKIKEDSKLEKFLTMGMDREATVGTGSAETCQAWHDYKDGLFDKIVHFFQDIVGVYEVCKDVDQKVVDGSMYSFTTGHDSDLGLYSGYMLYNQVRSLLTDEDSAVALARDRYYAKHPRDDSEAGEIARISGMTKAEAEIALAYADYLTYIANYDASDRYAFGGLDLEIERPILTEHSDKVMENLYAWHREEIEYKDARNREVATA